MLSRILPVVGPENTVQPVEVFNIVDIGNLSLVHIKTGDGHPAGNIVPFIHGIIAHATHGEGATFDEFQSGSGNRFLIRYYFKTAVFRVVVFPSGIREDSLEQETRSEKTAASNANDATLPYFSLLIRLNFLLLKTRAFYCLVFEFFFRTVELPGK
jgi:hypothetical protein